MDRYEAMHVYVFRDELSGSVKVSVSYQRSYARPKSIDWGPYDGLIPRTDAVLLDSSVKSLLTGILSRATEPEQLKLL